MNKYKRLLEYFFRTLVIPFYPSLTHEKWKEKKEKIIITEKNNKTRNDTLDVLKLKKFSRRQPGIRAKVFPSRRLSGEGCHGLKVSGDETVSQKPGIVNEPRKLADCVLGFVLAVMQRG